jgi:hypothetical protein
MPVIAPFAPSDLTLAGLMMMSPPISGNAAAGQATVVAPSYQPPASQPDGHFVIQTVPDAVNAWTRFLASDAVSGKATLDSP